MRILRLTVVGFLIAIVILLPFVDNVLFCSLLFLLPSISPAVRCTCCAIDFAPTVQQTLHLLHPFHYTVCACMYAIASMYVSMYVCMHVWQILFKSLIHCSNRKDKYTATNMLPGDLVPRGTKSPGDLVPRGTILWGVPNHRDSGTKQTRCSNTLLTSDPTCIYTYNTHKIQTRKASLTMGGPVPFAYGGWLAQRD